MMIVCSFCGKSYKDSFSLCVNTERETSICHNCVEQCYRYIHKLSNISIVEEVKGRQFLPKTLKAYLDRFVVGHDHAKKFISSIFAMHFIRVNKNLKTKKHNLLLAGPTGCGKTMLIETLAKYLDFPFISVDATSYTASGYIGEDVNSIASSLLEVAHGNLKKAEKGVVFIDEIDKIVGQGNFSGSRDIGGTAVQQELLKFIEGKKVVVPTDSKMPRFSSPTTMFDTSQVLFIVAGAFKDIEQIQYRMLPGFGLFETKSAFELDKFIDLSKALVEMGLLDELVGRIENHILLKELNAEELETILIGTDKPLLDDYQQYLTELNIQLHISPDAIKELVKKTVNTGLGARGLNKHLSDLILNNIFEYTGERTEQPIDMNIDIKNGEFDIKFEINI